MDEQKAVWHLPDEAGQPVGPYTSDQGELKVSGTNGTETKISAFSTMSYIAS
jgi:hypothetical protein